MDANTHHLHCLAPEVLRGEAHGHAVDWWSLGTLIYEMLTGLVSFYIHSNLIYDHLKPPFYSNNINIMYKKILDGELKFPSYLSADAQTIIKGVSVYPRYLWIF